MGKKNMAQIPYIVHEARMYKAYEREKRLKFLLVASNFLWSVVLLFLVMR